MAGTNAEPKVVTQESVFPGRFVAIYDQSPHRAPRSLASQVWSSLSVSRSKAKRCTPLSIALRAQQAAETRREDQSRPVRCAQWEGGPADATGAQVWGIANLNQESQLKSREKQSRKRGRLFKRD